MAERLYASRTVTIGTESMSGAGVKKYLFPFAIEPPIKNADPGIINSNEHGDASDTIIHIIGHDDDVTYGWVKSSDLYYQIGRNRLSRTSEDVHPSVTRRFEQFCDPLGIAVTQVVFLPEQRGNGAEM
jgi:hypothetical protein